jgi:cytochrome c oxidase assembly protein subunit 15
MNVNKNINILSLNIWLVTIVALISLIVFVGGLTRLTESGLSITVWEVFKGLLPPLNLQEWNNYFNEYKKIPEYKLLNIGMTLQEFKTIFYWEYAHRLLARFIAIISIIPLIYFSIKHKGFLINYKKYFFLFFLIVFQGFIGWYMVNSGLDKNIDVSHFRLAVHLSIALFILSLSLWFLFDLNKIKKFKIKLPSKLTLVILYLIVFQIVLGALLAGLNGGLIYNTWPDMNGSFLPTDSSLNDYFSVNVLSDPSIIQFFHRITAYLLFFLIIFLNIFYFKLKLDLKTLLFFDAAILIQIIFGIVTLLSGVMIEYASLHQMGSIIVLSSYLYIYYKNT